MLNVILVLLLVGLILSYRMRGQNPEASKRFIIALLVLTAVVLVARAGCRRRPEREARREMLQFLDALAHEMGAHIAERMPDESGIVVLLQSAPEGERSRAQARFFQRGLGDRFQVVPMQPSGLREAVEDDPDFFAILHQVALPVESFVEAAEQYPEAVAIASARWPPAVRAGARLPPGIPPVYVLDSSESPEFVIGLVHRGIVQAFAAMRVEPEWDRSPRPGMDPAELFGLRYMIYTRENLHQATP